MLGASLWCVIGILLLRELQGFCDAINAKFYDWKLTRNPLKKLSKEIVHLDIDDPAVQKFGRWPWDRAKSAMVVKRLSEFGAKVIIFDIVYASKGPTEEGDEALVQAIQQAGNVVSAVGPRISSNSKEILQDTTSDDRSDLLYERAWLLQVSEQFQLYHVVGLDDVKVPLTKVIIGSRQIGHIAGRPDSVDGVHRSIPLLVGLVDRYIPCLSLAALAVVWDLRFDDISLKPSGEIEIRQKEGTLNIPLDPLGMMRIRWGDPQESFAHYSLIDLFSDVPDPTRSNRYKDKVVIVGVTISGTTDIGITPVGASTPLNRIHSFALNTILSREFITSIRSWPSVILFSVVTALIFSVAAALLRLRLGVALAAGLFWGYPTISFVWFAYRACDIPFMEFWLIFSPAALISLSIRGASMELQAARASKAVERYLSPELLTNILDHPNGLDLSTKRRELTILFVDIKGFSTVCETVPVEYINQFLNEFMERMVSVIFEYHGTIDKFLGDGLLAFFGDPVPLENHARAAVQAGIRMQQEMAHLSEKWAKSGIAEFRHGTLIRIGINTGLLVVGNIGFARRMEYTVVGASVNIASRLQGIAPPGGMMLTARTKALAGDDFPYEGPDWVRVKGIDRDIEVYRILPEAIFLLPPKEPKTASNEKSGP